jgi:hypothetical protein
MKQSDKTLIQKIEVPFCLGPVIKHRPFQLQGRRNVIAEHLSCAQALHHGWVQCKCPLCNGIETDI